ncbi:oleosin family protein [Striga asiatica]|uniref:Oleosin family protein n=1 Tax=Striga asiatica TaxID=4170 RepID=A0A5A7R5G8_STRAF|nr:oleosin family protein [Striga asiatica]
MDIAPEKQQRVGPWRRHLGVSSKTAVMASAAALIVVGPLLCLMGISFAATVALLLVASPLFLIFFPVLFGAACVFGLAMLGFAAAGAMAVAGRFVVAWVLRSAADGRRDGDGVEREKGTDWAGYIQLGPYHATHTQQ